MVFGPPVDLREQAVDDAAMASSWRRHTSTQSSGRDVTEMEDAASVRDDVAVRRVAV